MNGDAGWRPSLAAIGWFFVLDAFDYGARLGSAPRVVGHICRSALLVRLLLALTPVARVVRGSSVRARAAPDPVVDKCRCRPGESK
jgi:hypothetical protein